MFNYFQAQKPQMPSYDRKDGQLLVEGKVNGKIFKWKQKKKRVRFAHPSYTRKNSIHWKTPHPKKRQTKRLNAHSNVPRHTI
jgi:hypothetical protein